VHPRRSARTGSAQGRAESSKTAVHIGYVEPLALAEQSLLAGVVGKGDDGDFHGLMISYHFLMINP